MREGRGTDHLIRRSWSMRELFHWALTTRAIPGWARYAATIALVLLAFALMMSGGQSMHRYPFLIFVPVILVTGIFFDRGNGILATLLSALLVQYYMLPPFYSLTIEAGDVLGLLLYIATGIFVALLAEALHRAYVELARRHEEIESAARQSGMLLGELSHRIRNDLTNLSLLLSSQSRAVQDELLRSALSAAANRIKVLARIYQRLSMQEGETVVDTREFITAHCDDLRVAFVGLRPIALELDVESHAMKLQRAVAVGLIINELVTNALKYAFSADESGRVGVEFRKLGNEYRLSVSDNGRGAKDAVPGTGIGLKLVRGLAGQLGGRCEMREERPGSVYVVTLPAA